MLEVTTCYLQRKYGVEIRIKSVNKDNSHSWIRISHGLNKLVTNLYNKDQDDNEQETPETKTEVFAFASRSKAKGKPQRPDSVSSSTRSIPIGQRTWTDIEPQKYSLSDYSVSKKLINLLRHGSLPRDNDGAIEFWRIKDYLQDHFVFCHHWSDEKWESSMARGGGGNKKRFQYRNDSSGAIMYLRALQGHSGRNLIDNSWPDNVVILDGFFKYIYHVGCAMNLRSIINSGLLPGSTWKHRVLHGTCIQHGRNIKTRCFGSTSNLFKRKVWSSIKHDRTPSFYTKHSQLIPKVVRMETGEIMYEKTYASPLPPPKISLKHDRMQELGVQKLLDKQKEKLLDNQKAPTQPNQTQIPIMVERGDPLCAKTHPVRVIRKSIHVSFVTARTSIWKKEANHDRTGADNQSVRPQRSMRWTSTSEYLDCHIQLWNQPKILVFASSSRRSRTTLIDKIFKPIYDKIMPATHLVKVQEDDKGHEHCRAIWVVRDKS